MVRLKQEDKSKRKNWVPGDTFAVKIENVDKDFDGKYLILTMFIHPYREQLRNYYYFHVKITDKKEKPKTIEEINSLEDVITLVTFWNMRFYPFKGLESLEEWEERTKDRVFIPDEFGYLNTYSTKIHFGRGIPIDNFEYIGNFEVSRPENEFMSECIQLNLNNPKTPFNYFVNGLIKNYINYNLRKSRLYTEEGLKQCRINNEKALEDVYNLDRFTQRMRNGENWEDILKEKKNKKKS